MQDNDTFKFKLSFKGQLIENSVDATELATTIIATTRSLERIATLKYGNEFADSLRININGFYQGSLQSEFVLFISEIANHLPSIAPLLPHAKQISTASKEILTSLKMFLDIKSSLKGKAPEKVTPLGNGNIHIAINGDNNTVIVSPDEFKVLQDKALSSDVAKIISPLIKESPEINEIDLLIDETSFVSIDQTKAAYLNAVDNFQELHNVKYKGIITKIDRKACTGFINLGKKRLAFSFKKDLSKSEFALLIDSLKNEIQVYLIGKVRMDFEANPKHMDIVSVEVDKQLF